jgi:hypothetical protein
VSARVCAFSGGGDLTWGMFRLLILSPQWVRMGSAFVMVYSVTSKSSFDESMFSSTHARTHARTHTNGRTAHLPFFFHLWVAHSQYQRTTGQWFREPRVTNPTVPSSSVRNTQTRERPNTQHDLTNCFAPPLPRREQVRRGHA